MNSNFAFAGVMTSIVSTKSYNQPLRSFTVYATGPDTASLTPGMLVLCNMFVTARDDPSVQLLMGLFSAGASRTLMDGEWRHSTWAEYAKFPLENLYPLNEELLLKKQGYSIHDLCKLPMSLVPYGGLDEIDLKVGETIVIAPVSEALSFYLPTWIR